MRICLNMIVRDEAAVIERCLRSARPYIQAWAVSDTGSSDGTQDIVRRVLGDLPGELMERPWVDFAANRNEALQLARRHGDYALFVDADETLDAAPGFTLPALRAPCYAIEVMVRGVGAWRPALARLDIDWTWHGVLHETLRAPAPVPSQRLVGIRIGNHEGGQRNRVGVREKYARDAELLRQALAAEPGDTRYQFYYAQSLLESGQWAAAFEAFRRRADAGGWAEEVYISKLMMAVLAAQLGAQEAQVVAAYRDAYSFRPQRAEALTRLAHFLLARKRYAEARDCARAACAIPVPDDTLLVDYAAYGWRPRDDLALALYHLGDIAGSNEMCRQMLADPQLPPRERERIERNLRDDR
jgi:tetratricopeptide (TPR) repeat protein